MTRERWAMVLLVALVLVCLAVTLNGTSKAQAPAVEARYDFEAVAVGDRHMTVVVLDRISGAVSVHDHYVSPPRDWVNFGSP